MADWPFCDIYPCSLSNLIFRGILIMAHMFFKNVSRERERERERESFDRCGTSLALDDGAMLLDMPWKSSRPLKKIVYTLELLMKSIPATKMVFPRPQAKNVDNSCFHQPTSIRTKICPPNEAPFTRQPRKPWPPKRCAVKTVAIEVLVRDIRGLSVRWGKMWISNKLVQVIVLFRPK